MFNFCLTKIYLHTIQNDYTGECMTIYFISIASVFSHVCMLHKAGMSVNAPFVAGWVATRTSPKLKLNLFSLLQVSS